MGPRVDDAATPRLPATAVGDHLTPSFVSTGRAIRMFGLPEGPGDDASPKTNEVAALSVDLQGCDLAEKKSPEAEADEATTATRSAPWPEVENHTIAGFTNWIAACQQADKNLGATTLPKWAEGRKQRQAVLQEALIGETAFNDQNFNLGSPLQY
ncbi:hypothetical protein KC316_g2391 [Hortaea werneckii]|nr:hypothetical protein KC324_g1998 [Hortaea werneckii]KAI7592266.1 hypothetical protein KC316_g2391 [Hortaea werneckii]